MGPEALALTSIGSSSAGGILGMFGKLAEGKSQSGMYQYRAGIAQLNQKIADQNRDWALQTGEFEAMRKGMVGRQQIGGIKAAQSGSGFDVNTGSAPEVVKGQQLATRVDMDTIRTNAARTAFGYSVEGVKQGAEAELYKKAASDVRKASYIGAATSLIGGATSVSSKWLQARDTGMFSSSTYSPTDPNYGG